MALWCQGARRQVLDGGFPGGCLDANEKRGAVTELMLVCQSDSGNRHHPACGFSDCHPPGSHRSCLTAFSWILSFVQVIPLLNWMRGRRAGSSGWSIVVGAGAPVVVGVGVVLIKRIWSI